VADEKTAATEPAESGNNPNDARPELLRLVEPRVDQIMRDASDFLKTAREFTFHAEVAFDDVIKWEQKVQYGASLDFSARRPDRLHAKYSGDLGERRFWYDGEHVTMFNATNDAFVTTAVPPTIDDALDHVMRKYNLSLPLADLVYSDLYDAVMGNVRTGFYVGLHRVDGVPCHHLAFDQDLIEWQVWIDAGRQTVVRKVVITYKQLPGTPQYTAMLSDWDFAPRLSDRLFVPELPDTAEELEFVPTKESATTR
jgi:hypothetical protein